MGKFRIECPHCGADLRGRMKARLPDLPPVPSGMALGVNAPMWFGWSVEDAKIRPDGTLNPAYVHDMGPFRVLRYMEAQRTNGSATVTVDDMEQPGWDQWPEGNGVPASYIAEHAALLGVRPWVCIPHMAAPELVEHMALELSGLRPIVEYSNEPFNTAMAQADWLEDQARARGYEGSKREVIYQLVADKVWDFGRIWRDIDPAAEFVFSIGMTDPPADLSVIGRSGADMLSAGAYLGIESAWGAYTHVRDYSADQLLNWLMVESLPRLRDWVSARKYDAAGLPVVIYEGGQHVKDDVVASSPEAQRHPGMKAVYMALLGMLDGIGVDLFCHYSGAVAMSNSTFGMKEYTGQPDSECPKWEAMRDQTC